MLPAAARMRRTAEFAAALRGGARAGTPALVVHLCPAGAGHQGMPTRVGFVVSRSIGGAVVRNQVRRRLRHLVRDRLDRLPTGSAVVVRANPSAAGLASPALARQLDRALTRLLSDGAP